MEDKFIVIKERLKTILKKDRYEHSLGVSYTSAALAMAHKEDIYKAKLTGLVHDCAKNISNQDILIELNLNGIKLSENELKSPQIWHAIYGPILAKKLFNIEDEDILSAIRFHTTGKDNMTKLEKIVFIADYIEPLRYKAENLDEIRYMAFKDLDKTIYMIVKNTVNYLKDKNIYIDENTLKCLKYLEENITYDK